MVRNYYWVARDRDDKLKLFDAEPIRLGDFFVQKWSFDEVWCLPEDLFRTVTWENSPKMVLFEY
jgi:hypothetical protein